MFRFQTCVKRQSGPMYSGRLKGEGVKRARDHQISGESEARLYTLKLDEQSLIRIGVPVHPLEPVAETNQDIPIV
jgi:hypothetical protein